MPPSRQERRRATRDAAKRASAHAGASGATAAAAALAKLNVHPGGDWSTQEGDPNVYCEALGAEVLIQAAAEGTARMASDRSPRQMTAFDNYGTRRHTAG